MGLEKPREVSAPGLFVYQSRLKHLESLKRQQWIITTYIFAIYGALLSARYFLLEKGASPSESQVFFLRGVAILACILGIVGLIGLQWDIGNAHREINKADDWIFGEHNKSDKTEREQIVGEPYEYPYRRGILFQSALIMFLIGGAALVFVFI
jgi:hypothetical protein